MGPFGREESPEIERLQKELYKARNMRDKAPSRTDRYWELEAAVLTLQDKLRNLRENAKRA